MHITASEITARSEAMSLELGATYGRLQTALLSPLIDRAFNLLKRKDYKMSSSTKVAPMLALCKVFGTLVQDDFYEELLKELKERMIVSAIHELMTGEKVAVKISYNIMDEIIVGYVIETEDNAKIDAFVDGADPKAVYDSFATTFIQNVLKRHAYELAQQEQDNFMEGLLQQLAGKGAAELDMSDLSDSPDDLDDDYIGKNGVQGEVELEEESPSEKIQKDPNYQGGDIPADLKAELDEEDGQRVS